MESLIDRWAEDASTQGMGKNSIDSYRCALKHFGEFYGLPEKADKMLIRAYVDMQRKKGITTKTISGRLNALNSFYEFLVFEGLRQDNPIPEIRKRYLQRYKKDNEEHTHKIISITEAARLVNSCMDIRDRAMVLLLLKTGVRRGELLSMEVSDIDFSNQSITLKPKKKRSNRVVFFDSETEYVLKRWLEARKTRRPKSDALWITAWGTKSKEDSIYDMVVKTATIAGLHDPESEAMEDHFSPHAARHFFTTHLQRSGMSRDHVKWLRGDVMREAIGIYNHIAPEDVRKSYLAHVPQLGV